VSSPNPNPQEIKLQSTTLAKELSAQRHHLHARPRQANGAGDWLYDPRFVVFEYTFDLLLRKSQVRFQKPIPQFGCFRLYSFLEVFSLLLIVLSIFSFRRLLTFKYPQQVELVRQIMGSLGQGESVCHQMIMGAGKTTVVGPLLALLLADGNTLVMQASLCF
jgi:hypothetical protein